MLKWIFKTFRSSFDFDWLLVDNVSFVPICCSGRIIAALRRAPLSITKIWYPLALPADFRNSSPSMYVLEKICKNQIPGFCESPSMYVLEKICKNLIPGFCECTYSIHASHETLVDCYRPFTWRTCWKICFENLPCLADPPSCSSASVRLLPPANHFSQSATIIACVECFYSPLYIVN